ncbi:hypothetical protein SUDANB178_07862 (plasmid) [Streptomyces sp. enrichment culture]
MADNPNGTYGAWIAELGLSEAIEREILAGFEIDVLEIRDPSPVLGESEEARRGRRLALLQTALLEHAAAHNLRTVMTFHQKVEEAAAFADDLAAADKLPKSSETAAELYVNDATDDDLGEGAEEAGAADKLPKSSIDAEFYELEAGRHVPPDRVWSAWLCGDHLVSERREVLRQFANGIDAAGRRVHRAFLASVRVLGEGVDITGERGVDSICFADTRGSQVEIVQNIGRALRLNRDGSTKVASRALTCGKRKIHVRRDEGHGRQRLVPPPRGRTSGPALSTMAPARAAAEAGAALRRRGTDRRRPAKRTGSTRRVAPAQLPKPPCCTSARDHRGLPAHPGLPARVPGLARGLSSPAALASGERDHRSLCRSV